MTLRVLKWCGLIMCVLLIVAWIVTMYWEVWYLTSENRGYALASGTIVVNVPDVHGDAGLSAARRRYQYYKLVYHRVGLNSWAVVPLWMLLTPALLVTASLWWKHRPGLPGTCQRCGYNLTGNVSGVCPECGTAIDRAETERLS